jgi:hypothetical protein
VALTCGKDGEICQYDKFTQQILEREWNDPVMESKMGRCQRNRNYNA